MTREDLTTFLDHVVDMMRFEAHIRQGVLKQLNRLHRQVKAYMASEDLTQLNQRQLNALIKEISVITGQTYDALLAQMQAHSQDLHQHEHEFMQTEFGDAWGVPPEVKPKSNFVPLVLGLTLAELLRKQQRDYIHLIKMSARNNEPIDHLSRWQSNKTKALTKTWVSSVSSQTRERLAKRAKKIKGWWHNSILDGRTSNICLARHNKVWDKEGKPIGHDIPFRRDPLHPHCRSHVLPVTDVNQKPATMSVEDWLDGKTQAEQDRLLGKGKAQMYRKGDITLSDLLDQFGRPKTLASFKISHPKAYSNLLKQTPLTQQAIKAKISNDAPTRALQTLMGESYHRLTVGELNDPHIKKGLVQYGLTQAEATAIRYYTRDGYDELNAYLRGKIKSNNELKIVVDLIQQGLSKLPNYANIVVRRDNLPADLLAQHKIGSVVTYDGFTSATFGSKDVFSSKPHRLVIHSKTGKQIEWISAVGREKEVLFMSPTRFKVGKVEQLPDGTIQIRLDEL